MMDTYFAPAERASDDDLQMNIEIVSQNPVVDGLLDVVGGLLAVLNEHRQILTINEALVNTLEIDNIDGILGLRPGEALNCIHANEMPGGCGTSRYCSSCGAAISIVTSLEQNAPVEQVCVMTVNKKDKQVDLCFSVRAYPIQFENHRLLLLFLLDVTKQQQWATLERVFFHDIKNILTGLLGNSSLLLPRTEGQAHTIAQSVYNLSLRLTQEVAIQQVLTQTDVNLYQTKLQELTVHDLFEELKQMFYNHSAAVDKSLMFSETSNDFSFKTDINLVMRVLGNMITNALEASESGDEVKVTFQLRGEGAIFQVWNRQFIPDNIACRIFQRNFTTRKQLGRGLGTYSMKLFGEDFLGGKVSFTSNEEAGTTFVFELPV